MSEYVSPSKLIEQLENNESGLTEFDLTNSYIFAPNTINQTMKRISEALKTNTHVTKLILANNGLDDTHAAMIGDALSQNKSIQYLDLQKNKIGSAGAESIANGLKQNTTLKEINILSQGKGINF